ncbi:hypothetical protein VULLAG_LOCUS16529 [Vulpes lagopus]
MFPQSWGSHGMKAKVPPDGLKGHAGRPTRPLTSAICDGLEG